MITKNSTLHIRIPESELKASQKTAEALKMHHSEFVREAIREKVRSVKIVKPYKERRTTNILKMKPVKSDAWKTIGGNSVYSCPKCGVNVRKGQPFCINKHCNVTNGLIEIEW